MTTVSEDTPRTLVLASKSPRRAELLEQIGVPFEQAAVDINETPHLNECAEDLVVRLACEKAQAGLAVRQHSVVLGSDTVVAVGRDILGKPRDLADSQRMLERLSGTQHEVMSAVCVADQNRSLWRLSCTKVSFRDIESDEILKYWNTGEPCDKAGSYAIQGLAATFVSNIEGSYSGVMGLPLYETAELLSEFGISGWWNG
jgi:septum formation protein